MSAVSTTLNGRTVVAAGFIFLSIYAGGHSALGGDQLWIFQRLMLFTAATLLLVGFGASYAGGLALEALARCDAWLLKRSGRITFFLSVLVLAYVGLWCAISFLRHYYFHSSYDLAIMNQVAWNTAQGRWFARSIEVSNDLGDHVRPYLAALGFAYLVVPSPYVLLGFQSLVLGASAVPTYRLARRHLDSPAAGLIVALCFLAYPPLGFVNHYDFHVEVLSVPLLIAAFERIDARDFRRASVFMALTLFCKENLGLTVAALGIMAALCYNKWRFGMAWLGVGGAYSSAALLLVIPAFRGEASDTLARYQWLGDTPSGIAWAVFAQPWLVIQKIFAIEHILTLLQLLAPLALLPVLGWPALLPAAPTLMYNFLAEWTTQATIYSHYMTPAIPFMPIAAVIGLRRLVGSSWAEVFGGAAPRGLPHTKRSVALGVMVMMIATFASWTYENPVTGNAVVSLKMLAEVVPMGVKAPVPIRWENDAAIREGLRLVPPEARLLTTAHYAAHLSARRWIEMIPRAPVKTLDPEANAVLLNLSDHRSWSCDDYLGTLRAAALSNFGVVFNRDQVVLIEKNRGDQTQLRKLIADWQGCT